MKIINTQYRPSFGYDKAYHQNVKEYLGARKTNKNMAQTLIAADEFSLQLEDRIIEMEKNGQAKKLQSFDDIVELLGLLKADLSIYFDYHFPKLEYTKTVAAQYEKEAKSEVDPVKISWRQKIANKVNPKSIKPPISEEKNVETKASGVSETELKKTVEEIQKQAIDEFESKMEKSILEQFNPTDSSPKGFCDVVGMDDVKQKINEDLLVYVKNPELRQLDEEEYGIRAPRGFLFYGPPGCGKTFIAQAIAAESELPMYKLDISKAGSKFVNQTAVNIQSAFDLLAQKAQKTGKPVLLFMDEVDSLAIKRNDSDLSSGENLKATTTLLKLVEQARDKSVIVIAATNKYDMLDDAFKARFDGQIYFGLPDEKQIESLLVSSLSRRKKGLKLAQNKEQIANLVNELKGYSNRSIVFIVDDAAKIARRKQRQDISLADIQEAIKNSELEKLKETDFLKKSKIKKRKLGFGEA